MFQMDSELVEPGRRFAEVVISIMTEEGSNS